MASSSSVALKLTCMVLMCMVTSEPFAQAAITCGMVAKNIAPCIPYLTEKSSLSAVCCTGVKNLNSTAKTTPERQDACTCLKSMAKEISDLNESLTAELPKKCGVDIPYKISQDIDCSKVE